MPTAPLFVDTSYWVARLDRADSLHERSRRLDSRIGSAVMITTEMVLVETLNHLAAAGPGARRAAHLLVRSLRGRADFVVMPQTSSQFDAALAIYESRSDKGWSLTDCASLLVIQAHGIREVLTYDRHFEQMGLAALLRG